MLLCSGLMLLHEDVVHMHGLVQGRPLTAEVVEKLWIDKLMLIRLWVSLEHVVRRLFRC